MYIKDIPKKNLKKVSKKAKLVVWEPFIEVTYEAKRLKTVFFDALIPEIIQDSSIRPLIRVLLARSFKSQEYTPVKPNISNFRDVVMEPKSNIDDVVSDLEALPYLIKSAYEIERRRLEDKLSEDFEATWEWKKFTMYLIPPTKTTRERALMVGREPWDITFSIIKEIAENGLAIDEETKVKVISWQYVNVPLIISEEMEVYEPMISSNLSKSYTKMINEDTSVRDFFQKFLIEDKSKSM